jgi:hypothetical protein
METKEQPLRGLIPTICVAIASLTYIFVGEIILSIKPYMLAVYALFFVWTAFMVSLCDRWPFHKVRQPYAGFILLTITIVSGMLHPMIMSLFKWNSEYYWSMIANLFLRIGITMAFDNKLVEGFKQPKSIVFNGIFWYIFAIVLTLSVGMVPAIWFAWFIYLFFWLEKWPVQDVSQPRKGILLFLMLGLFSFLLYGLFGLFGTHFFNPDAGLWFVLFVWWLVVTSWQLETWPFKNTPQPRKGLSGLIITVLLTFLSYYIIVFLLRMNLLTARAYSWIFVSWLYSWDIVLGKWPA